MTERNCSFRGGLGQFIEPLRMITSILWVGRLDTTPSLTGHGQEASLEFIPPSLIMTGRSPIRIVPLNTLRTARKYVPFPFPLQIWRLRFADLFSTIN